MNTEKQIQRLFIGSFLESEGIEVIRNWRKSQSDWAVQCGTKVRWVVDDQLHLTWRFLGDTPVSQIPILEAGMTGALKNSSSFSLDFNRLAIWPHAKKPQVLVWLADLTEGCKDVAEAIQAPYGGSAEHVFQPHITLARFKPTQAFRRSPMVLPEGHELEPLDWLVQDVHLVESVLKPAGAEYHLHRRWVLQGGK